MSAQSEPAALRIRAFARERWGRREWSLGHRPGLDGLRAIAVLLVMGAHAKVSGFIYAGQSGVIMFFALSGFLITTLLVEEGRATGRFSLIRFYLRRALRLLPALAVMVLVVSIADRALHHPNWKLDAVAVAFYFANWLKVTGAQMGPLDHTWTLAVEEQFYLLWPVLLLVLLRTRIPAQITLAVAVASFLWAVVLWNMGGTTRVYFGTDTRVGSIFLGAVVGLMIARGRRLWVPTPVAVIAALTIVVLFEFVNTPTSSDLLDPPLVTIAMLLLIAWVVDGPHRSPLSWAPLVGIGRISYGVYLWHQPIFVLLGPRLAFLPFALNVVVLFTLSIGTAMVSYRVIEQPFLRLKDTRWTSRRTRIPEQELAEQELTSPSVT